MKVKEMPFQKLLAHPLLVRYDASRLFEAHEELTWPDEADSILGYPYYDCQAGLNLAILAPHQAMLLWGINEFHKTHGGLCFRQLEDVDKCRPDGWGPMWPIIFWVPWQSFVAAPD